RALTARGELFRQPSMRQRCTVCQCRRTYGARHKESQMPTTHRDSRPRQAARAPARGIVPRKRPTTQATRGRKLALAAGVAPFLWTGASLASRRGGHGGRGSLALRRSLALYALVLSVGKVVAVMRNRTSAS